MEIQDVMKIVNKKQLVENGLTQADRRARSIALQSLEFALKSVDPRRLLQSEFQLKGTNLRLGEHRLDLADFQNIFVVGGGKASGSMAEWLDEQIGGYITDGIVIVPYNHGYRTKSLRIHEAGHPIPDGSGVDGTRRILEVADRAGEKDLIICLLSGGGSSLMSLPRSGILLSELRMTTESLLKSGAGIKEINTIRKHLSGIKGGWLAKRAYPAPILNIVLSDVAGDSLDVIASGPTVPDLTSFSDAIRILEKYHLWPETPESIRRVLLDGKRGIEVGTPKADDVVFKHNRSIIIGNNGVACRSLMEQLKALGLNPVLLSSALEAEARHVGMLLASIGCEVFLSGNPVVRPAGIVAGGETTVRLAESGGLGGRNQELVLAASEKITSEKGLVVASMSTDGVDGPTEAAGAIADGSTIKRATEQELDPARFLQEHDSYSFFSALGDLILTGATGTNVSDVSVIIAL